MKNIVKILSLLLFLTASSTVFASDDPKTTKENTKETPNEQCQDLATTQLVNVQVRFTDCPDYTCEVKVCQLAVCIYDYNYNLIDCKPFDPDNCTYDFTRINAELNQPIRARLIKVSGGDPCVFNTAWGNSAQVTTGVYDYAIDLQLCQ